MLLIAPTSYHRLRFRASDKERLLLTANRLAICGLGLLALAMTGVVLLVTDVLYSTPVTVATTAGMVAFLAGLWFALPLARWARDEWAGTSEKALDDVPEEVRS